MITVSIGDYVRCNTIGHITSGLEGVLERICNTEEDRNLGLSPDYGMVNGLAVNLHNCKKLVFDTNGTYVGVFARIWKNEENPSDSYFIGNEELD